MIDRELIRQKMGERGVSYRVLAAMVSERSRRGISGQAIEAFVSGKNSMNVEHVATLAACLGVGISDIVKEPVRA